MLVLDELGERLDLSAIAIIGARELLIEASHAPEHLRARRGLAGETGNFLHLRHPAIGLCKDIGHLAIEPGLESGLAVGERACEEIGHAGRRPPQPRRRAGPGAALWDRA